MAMLKDLKLKDIIYKTVLLINAISLSMKKAFIMSQLIQI